jgi:hypothetical protein
MCTCSAGGCCTPRAGAAKVLGVLPAVVVILDRPNALACSSTLHKVTDLTHADHTKRANSRCMVRTSALSRLRARTSAAHTRQHCQRRCTRGRMPQHAQRSHARRPAGRATQSPEAARAAAPARRRSGAGAPASPRRCTASASAAAPRSAAAPPWRPRLPPAGRRPGSWRCWRVSPRARWGPTQGSALRLAAAAPRHPHCAHLRVLDALSAS